MKDGELLVGRGTGRRTEGDFHLRSGQAARLRDETSGGRRRALPAARDAAQRRRLCRGQGWHALADRFQRSRAALRQVRQMARNQEVLRPARISSPEIRSRSTSKLRTTGEEIFLLERNDLVERFRGLTLLRDDGRRGRSRFRLEESLRQEDRRAPQLRARKQQTGGDFRDDADPARKAFAKAATRSVAARSAGQSRTRGRVRCRWQFSQNRRRPPAAHDQRHAAILSRALLARPMATTRSMFSRTTARWWSNSGFRNLTEMIAFDCGDFELK